MTELLVSDSQWHLSVVDGAQGRIHRGLAATAKDPQGHPAGSFSSGGTVILGDHVKTDGSQEVMASWLIPLSSQLVHGFQQGYLVIGCIRYFGGLHSEVYNTKASVLLNGGIIDTVWLRHKPETHADYFHRIPLPDFPDVEPFSMCMTRYAWPVLQEKLSSSGEQEVSVHLESNAWWDIDYVGLLMRTARANRRVTAFLCHSSEDKGVVRELYSRLMRIGVAPWLDEMDILPGAEWELEIRKAIRECDVVLACLSAKSVSKTGFVQKEIRFALDRADEKPPGTVYIIPVLLEACAVPERLARWQWVDLSELNGFDRLIDAIRVHREPGTRSGSSA